MNVLLLSMPDSFEHTPTVSIRMPNGALTSLAGNVDPHHRIAVADLILVQSPVRATLEELVKEIQPDLVGLSVMTFQRKTAKKIIELVRSLKPGARIVVGGYDPSMAPEAYTEQFGSVVDFHRAWRRRESLFASCCGQSKPTAVMSAFWACRTERTAVSATILIARSALLTTVR